MSERLPAWTRRLVGRLFAAAAVIPLLVLILAFVSLQATLEAAQRGAVAALAGRELVGAARQMAGGLSSAEGLEPGTLAFLLRRSLRGDEAEPKRALALALQHMPAGDLRFVHRQLAGLHERVQLFATQHPDLRAVDVAVDLIPGRAVFVLRAGDEWGDVSSPRGPRMAPGRLIDDIGRMGGVQDAAAFDGRHGATDFAAGRMRIPLSAGEAPVGSLFIQMDLRPVREQVAGSFASLHRAAGAGALLLAAVLLALAAGGTGYAARAVRARLVDPLARLAAILGRVGPADGRLQESVAAAGRELENFTERRAIPDELGGVAEAARRHLGRLGGALDALEARGQELERANAALHEAMARATQAARGITMAELGGWIAHDLNNKLQAAYGIARDWIRRGRPCPPEQLQHVLVSVEAATEQIQSLRDLARPRAAPRFEPDVAVRDVLRETMLLVGTSLEKAGVAVEADVAEDARLARADPSRLRDALMNLLLNARDAIRAGGAPGTIRVSAAREGHDVVLTVADNGCGMAPDAVAGIFERPFFTTKGEAGTGLGLRIVRAAVEDHGGTVTCASTPGKGATFTIRLPGAG